MGHLTAVHVFAQFVSSVLCSHGVLTKNHVQSDLAYPDFLIIRTGFCGPVFFFMNINKTVG